MRFNNKVKNLLTSLFCFLFGNNVQIFWVEPLFGYNSFSNVCQAFEAAYQKI